MLIRHQLARLVVLPVLCLLQGCFYTQSASREDGLILLDHPLTGKIWDVKGRQFIETEQLHAVVARNRYVFLGETHDNIQHHRYQAQVIAKLSDSNRRVQVFFEMIDENQGKKIAHAKIDDLEQLMNILEQDDPGWNYEQMYRVVFEQAFRAGFDIRSANPPRETVVAVMRQGDAAMPDRIRQLIKKTPLDADQIRAMELEAREAHCAMMPENMIKPMVLGQRLRDAGLALNFAQGEGEVNLLLTGSGHARRDRGVPLYMQSQQLGYDALVSIAFLEVAEDSTVPADYLQRWDDTLPFDYVWFTPRYNRPDPCEGLREHFKKSESTGS